MRWWDERIALVQLYCFWTKVRQNLILIHVFSGLLLAHETVESTAEEKYLIYILEKALLQTGFSGNSWVGFNGLVLPEDKLYEHKCLFCHYIYICKKTPNNSDCFMRNYPDLVPSRCFSQAEGIIPKNSLKKVLHGS